MGGKREGEGRKGEYRDEGPLSEILNTPLALNETGEKTFFDLSYDAMCTDRHTLCVAKPTR